MANKKDGLTLLKNWFPKWVVVVFLILIIVVASSYALYSAVKYATLFRYKSSQIKKGVIYFDSKWGWIDQVHYQVCRNRLKLLENQLSSSRENPIIVHLEGQSQTAYGTWFKTQCFYRVSTNLLTSDSIKIVAAVIALDMAVEEEKEQELAPFVTGLSLSAWQFDDIPSALLACLDYLGKGRELRISSEDIIDASVRRFNSEANDLLNEIVSKPTLPNTVNSIQKNNFQWLKNYRVIAISPSHKKIENTPTKNDPALI